MKLSMRIAMVMVTTAVFTAYGQKITPGVNPRDLADPEAVPFKKAPPPPPVNTNDELAVTEARYNEVFKEMGEIAQEQGRLQGEMRNLRNMKEPGSTFGTNDAEFVKMRAELSDLEKRVKELREAVAKRQMEMPEYQKVIALMQENSTRIQELEKRKKTLMADRIYIVSKINNIKKQREEEAKKKADAAAAGAGADSTSKVPAETDMAGPPGGEKK